MPYNEIVKWILNQTDRTVIADIKDICEERDHALEEIETGVLKEAFLEAFRKCKAARLDFEYDGLLLDDEECFAFFY